MAWWLWETRLPVCSLLCLSALLALDTNFPNNSGITVTAITNKHLGYSFYLCSNCSKYLFASNPPP